MLAEKRPLHCFCICLFMCGTLHVSPSAASTEYSRYLLHIFNKYGAGGTMSFEGLEHLMHNLGLGQIEFEPTHTIDEHRSEGHNHKDSENDNLSEKFFEDQTTKLLDQESGIPLAPTIQQQQKQQHHHQQQQQRLIQNVAAAEDIATTTSTAPATPHDHHTSGKRVVLEFKGMHDPKHRHPRENDASFPLPPLNPNTCLSPKSLLSLVIDHDDLHKRKLYKTVTNNVNDANNDAGDAAVHNYDDEYNEFINTVKLTPAAFMKLCPALLSQIDQQVCIRALPLTHGEDPEESLWNAWIYASCSLFILSCCGLVGICLVPLMKTSAYQEILKLLVAIAVGTLSGDALMHLLPHALVPDHETESHMHEASNSHEHVHDNGPVWICACAFLTACFMYILENLLPLLNNKKSSSHEHAHGHGHSHSHAHGHTHNTKSCPETPPAPTGVATAMQPGPTTSVSTLDTREINVMLNEQQQDKKAVSRPLTPLAFMVIIGDGLHNLTDGLAIGAAFATTPVTGLATAFAVFCHELPHELGDFALLLQTGVSMRRAVFLNIISSVLSFIGMAIGLLIAGTHTSMTRWIYAGTAGSFLYIAFADLLPAMAAEGRRDFKSNLIQIFGILIGGVIMLFIALYEHDLEDLFK